MANQKYEITDIAHEKYPFLHRIRALRDIGSKVKAGDLGGFVESENNLSTEDDISWIFGDAIAAGDAFVDQDARLFGKAVACDSAYVSQGAELSGEARIEDSAYIRGAVMCGHARASAHSMILDSPDTGKAPALSETCIVYGVVMGDVHIMGGTVVLGNEKITNETLDTLVINGQKRSVIRNPSRNELVPHRQQKKQEKQKNRGIRAGTGENQETTWYKITAVREGGRNVKLEERLAEYMRSDEFQMDISEIAADYQRQGLPVPPAEQLRDEAVSEARKCLETIMICEEKGHLWDEKADPENGRSELTCRRCGAVENLQW